MESAYKPTEYPTKPKMSEIPLPPAIAIGRSRIYRAEKDQIHRSSLTIVVSFGSLPSHNDLPPPGIKRWVVRRKVEALTVAHGGLISL